MEIHTHSHKQLYLKVSSEWVIITPNNSSVFSILYKLLFIMIIFLKQPKIPQSWCNRWVGVCVCVCVCDVVWDVWYGGCVVWCDSPRPKILVWLVKDFKDEVQHQPSSETCFMFHFALLPSDIIWLIWPINMHKRGPTTTTMTMTVFTFWWFQAVPWQTFHQYREYIWEQDNHWLQMSLWSTQSPQQSVLLTLSEKTCKWKMSR